MKVAVSIPDDLFEESERLAKDQGGPRSALYARALREYVARHSPDRITDALNAVVDALAEKHDGFLARAAARTAQQTEW
jgi:metal-responsive CopG/Arc/MetJ family transcriptional regulator